MNNVLVRIVMSLGFAAMATGCSGSIGSTPAPGPSAPAPMPPNKIKHIVVLVQENRSFNNLFAGFPGATTSMRGLCKPAPRTWSFTTPWCVKEHEVPLRSVPLEDDGAYPSYSGKDICHTHQCLETECDPNAAHVCAMDGFDLMVISEGSIGGPARLYPYRYVERRETKPYWDFARQYTLADRMFFTETASSFIAHQMLISGTVQLKPGEWVTNEPPNNPWGCWFGRQYHDYAPILHANGSISGSVWPCFSWATIADLLDAKRVSWLFYVDSAFGKDSDFSGGVWNGFAAIRKIYNGPDFKKNISSPNANIFSDLKNGSFPAVSWVIPSFYESDHPAAGCNGGPWWVTKVVDAIGESKYWDSTAIILIWDDWGGWYDPVAPKYLNPSTLGMRVPMIVISPYARPSYVSHTQYDFGSILKFQEQTFNLGSLGTTDSTAASMDDVFDFSQTPIPFKSEALPPVMDCVKLPVDENAAKKIIQRDGGVPD